MARLVVKTEGFENQPIELKLGINRIGRSPDIDFQIVHPTVSAIHCELVLADGAVLLRDLESTNGTFVGGQRVREVKLTGGETVRLGDVELFVESADTTVAIPKFLNTELPAPPVVATDGGLYCPRHAKVAVTFQCTVCKEVMCDACVHTLRRKGGKNVLLLCPICSNAVEPLGGAKKSPKKKSLLARVGETVKLKFTRGIRVGDGR